MAYAFNQLASDRKAQARQEGQERVGPYLEEWGDKPTYSMLSRLCSVSQAGCTFDAMEGIFASRTIPMNLDYRGEGVYDLPFGNPIRHRIPEPGVWVNDTLDGHILHPGSVAHTLYESGGSVWIYSEGRGMTDHMTFNKVSGYGLFGSTHIATSMIARQYVRSRNPDLLR